MKRLLIIGFFVLFAGIRPASATGSCGGFRTYTQGGWGTSASGNNPGTYRNNNFSAAFPNGLTIGCTGGYKLKLTSSNAVNTFLPAGGTAGKLTQNHTNPSSSGAGVLAGQLVALTLSVVFDEYDPNFGSSGRLLKYQVITMPSSPFNGISVNDFLALANAYVGGCPSPYTASQFNTVATAINENYDNGCESQGDLDCPPSPVLSKTSVNVTCNGGSNGSITLNVTGGHPPYTYSWSNGATTKDISGLTAGTYTVTVTDAYMATATLSETISQPAAISVSATSANVICFGASTGSITLTGSGGTAPYTWSKDGVNFQGSNVFSNLAAGTYTITLKDNKGCTKTKSVTITQPATGTTVTVNSQTNVNCFGASTGSITLSASGGVSPYTWSKDGVNFQSSATFGSLAAGNYTFTVKGYNGCTATKSVTITGPSAALSASIGSETNVLCYGESTGSVTMYATGGTSPYTWSKNGVNFQSSATFSSLAAGNYVITVKDANNCIATQSVSITQPASALVASVSSEMDVLCYGTSTGSVTMSAAGGTSPYTWSKDGVNFQSSATFTSLAAGNYTITVKDANNCTAAQSISITQPSAALVASVGTETDVLCHGASTGSVIMSAAGGTGPYTWSKDGVNFQGSAIFSSLAAGNYTITVKDANHCTATKAVSITQPASVLGVTIGSINGTCSNASTGSMSASATGGTSPYAYSWNTGAATASVNNLAGGSYSVTATDANGCTANASASVSTLPKPTASLSVVLNNCVNEMLEAARGFNVFVKEDAILRTNETDGGVAIGGNLTLNGSYTIAGHSAGTFIDSGDTRASALVVGGRVFYTSGSGINVVNNGFVKICNPAGSNIYDWDTQNNQPQNTRIAAGNKDSNPRINLSTHQSAASIKRCPINFTDAFTRLSVTSQNLAQCTNNVTLLPSEPSNPTASPERKKIQLASGKNVLNLTWAALSALNELVFMNQPTASSSLLINVTGTGSNVSWNIPNMPGIGDQQGQFIIWNFISVPQLTMNGGGTLKGTLFAPNTAVIDNNSGNIDGQLIAKSYDHNGGEMHNYPFAGNITGCGTSQNCSAAAGDTVWVCKNATVNIKAAGGTSYQWSNGATSETVTLGQGSYFVIANGSNGCKDTARIRIQEYPQIQLSYQATNLSCYQSANGAVTLTVSGGVAPFSYAWSTGATTASLSNLAAGTYSVTVTDARGCAAAASVNITQPALLTATPSVTNVTTYAGSNGSININLTGGTAPYTYLWSTGAVSSSLSGIPAGVYAVTVTDANGCIVTSEVSVTQPPSSCTGMRTQTQGGWGATPQGNNPAAYLHNHFAAAFPSGLTIGCTNTLKLTTAQKVTDFLPSGSTASALPPGAMVNPASYSNVLAGQLVALTLNVKFDQYDPNFGSSSKQLADAFISSGPFANWTVQQLLDEANKKIGGCASNYSFSDLNSALTSINQNFDNGNITGSFLTCCNTITTTITALNGTCANNKTGFAKATATGGKPPYTYQWSNGAATDSISTAAAGTYYVTIKDSLGCSAVDSAIISVVACCNATNGGIIAGEEAGCGPVFDPAPITSVSLPSGGSGAVEYVWIMNHNNVGFNNGNNGWVAIPGTNSPTYDPGPITQSTWYIRCARTAGCNSFVAETSPIGKIVRQRPQVAETHQHILCYGATNGSASVVATGGTPPYQYHWSNNETSASVSDLAPGTYTVWVSDSAGCGSDTLSITIEAPSQGISLSLTKSDATCLINNKGTASVTATGGAAPYTYLWSNGATSSAVNGLTPGTYNVTVTDAKGCTKTGSITIAIELITIYSVANGDWNNPSTWDIGRVPTVCDDVRIIGSHEVTVNAGGPKAECRDLFCDGTSKLTIYDTLDCRDYKSEDNGQVTKVYGQLNVCSMKIDDNSDLYACTNVHISNCTNKNKPLVVTNGGEIHPLGAPYCTGKPKFNIESDSIDIDLSDICNAVDIQDLTMAYGFVTFPPCLVIHGVVTMEPYAEATGYIPTWMPTSSLVINREYTFTSSGNSNILWPNGSTNVPRTITLTSNVTIATPKVVVNRINVIDSTVTGGDNIIITNNALVYICGGQFSAAPAYGTNVTTQYCDVQPGNPPAIIGDNMPPGGFTGNLIISTNVKLGENVVVAGNVIVNSTGELYDSTFNFTQAQNVVVDSGAIVHLTKGGGLTGSGSLFGNIPTTLSCGSTVIYESDSGVQEIDPRMDYGNVTLNGTSNKTFASANYGICGDLTITPSSGSVNMPVESNIILAGNVDQAVTTAEPATVFDISCTGTGTKTISGPVRVNGTVEVEPGAVLNTGNNLTLTSTKERDAIIGPLVNGADIVGTICWERFIPGGSSRRRWRFLTMPIYGLTFNEAWQDDFFITGPGTGGTPCDFNTTAVTSMVPNNNGFDQNHTGVETIFTWNEPTATWVTIPTTTSTIINPLKAYRTYVRGSRWVEGCMLMTLMPDSVSDVLIDACGPLVKFTQTAPLTYTPGTGNGWNYVSNPYPSPIAWNNPAWTAARAGVVDPTLYVYDPAISQYASWHPVAGAVNGGSPIIGKDQSFFIRVNQNYNMVFEEMYKVDTLRAGFFGKSAVADVAKNRLSIKLTSAVTGTKDETVLYMNSNATHGYDASYDGYKSGYAVGGIAIAQKNATGLKFMFAGIPVTVTADTINLVTGLSNTDNQYTLSFGSFDKIGTEFTYFLLDKANGTLTNIRINQSYTFNTYAATSSSYSPGRFQLIIVNNPSLPVSLIDFTGKKAIGGNELKWTTASEINNSHFVVEHSTDGETFTAISTVKGHGTTTKENVYQLIHAGPAKTLNYYRLRQVDHNSKEHLSHAIIVDNNEAVIAKGDISIFPVPAKDVLNVSFASGGKISVRVFDIVGKTVLSKENVTVSANDKLALEVSSLQAGTYIISIDDASGEQKQIKFIKD